MSAFMCSPETIYLITNAIFSIRHIKELQSLKILPKKDPLSVSREDLFHILYKMNRDALVERYGEDGAEELCGYSEQDGFLKGRRYWNGREEEYTDTLLYYRIGCLLYQCSEGSIEESSLYNYIGKVKTEVACHIVEGSDDYLNITIDNWS